MKSRLAIFALILACSITFYIYSVRKEEERLQNLVSEEVIAILDEHFELHGQYPDSLHDIPDSRLDTIRAEPKMGYLPGDFRRLFSVLVQEAWLLKHVPMGLSRGLSEMEFGQMKLNPNRVGGGN